MKKTIVIKTDLQAREAVKIIGNIPLDGSWSVTFSETNIRNLEQNSALWAGLKDISNQVVWYGEKLTSEQWKDVLTAGLKKSKVVPGIDGGFVVLGGRTSKMTKKEMSELLELMIAFGTEHGVKFSM